MNFFLRKRKVMNSPLEKPKHIKQLQLSAEKKIQFSPVHYMLLLWFSWSPTSVYHVSHQLLALVILYYIDTCFEITPLFTSLIIILFSRPVSFLQTHPQDITPSFLFNTEKHNSHGQWISLLTNSFLFNFVIVLAEQLLYSKINSVPYTFSTPST